MEIIRKPINVLDWKSAVDEFWTGDNCNYTVTRDAGAEEYQTKIGKYGEIGTSLYLESKGYPRLFPDFKIYSGKEKTWEADLPYNLIEVGKQPVHVKTCSQSTVNLIHRYGFPDTYSWTFQVWDVLYRNRLTTLLDDNIVSLCYMKDVSANNATIVALVTWKEIKRKLTLPAKAGHSQDKRCLNSSAIGI